MRSASLAAASSGPSPNLMDPLGTTPPGRAASSQLPPTSRREKGLPWGVLASLLMAAGLTSLSSCDGGSSPPAPESSTQGSAGSERKASKRLPPAGKLSPPPQPKDAELRTLVDRVLEFTLEGRELGIERHAAWQLMHGVLAYGRGFEAVNEGDENRPVNVVDWALAGKPMKGWNIRPTDRGLRAEIDPGKLGQGHEDQWLAILSQSDVRVTDPLVVEGKTYQVFDLLKRAMYDCYEGKESSWTLITLSQYLDPLDQTWTARDGETWSVQRLAGMEAGPVYDERLAQQHINLAACGGTHRMIGLAMALNRYRQDYPAVPLEGGWLAAQRRVEWAIAAARENQLPSGAFSIMYFTRPSNSASIDEHLASTGHLLEFLSLALPQQELRQPWVQRAVHYLCDLFERTRHVELECGALYHAAHGLVLYRDRAF